MQPFGRELVAVVGRRRERPQLPTQICSTATAKAKFRGGPVVVAAVLPPLCPLSSALMLTRRGPSTGRLFWSCKHYPVCHGTRPRVARPRAAGTKSPAFSAQAFNFLISSASTHRARLRLTPRSMLATLRVRMRLP